MHPDGRHEYSLSIVAFFLMQQLSRRKRLKEICEENGMLQLVRRPTRGENLLDLLLSDIDNCKAMIADPIADHRAILAFVKLPMPREIIVQRDVWHFKQARWQNMRCVA